LQLEAEALQRLVGEVTEAVLRNRTVAPGDAGTAQSVVAPTLAAADLAKKIDHTLLRPEATRPEVERLCAEARAHRFASVCVSSLWVSLAARLLRHTGVAVGTVVGFPSGAVPTKVKCLEAETAISNGACELDMVIPVGLLRSSELDMVKQDIQAVTDLCKRHSTTLKVILETAVLTDEEVAIGCALARIAGAHYVKTATGFHPGGGATARHVSLMRQVVGNDMGVKAAGGIRTAAAAIEMIHAGASRIGSSASVTMMQELAR
jgi:deoxyribose-phosphate aldolase